MKNKDSDIEILDSTTQDDDSDTFKTILGIIVIAGMIAEGILKIIDFLDNESDE